VRITVFDLKDNFNTKVKNMEKQDASKCTGSGDLTPIIIETPSKYGFSLT